MIQLAELSQGRINFLIFWLILAIICYLYNGNRFKEFSKIILFLTACFAFMFAFKDIPATYLVAKQTILDYGDSIEIILPLGYVILDIAIIVVTLKRSSQLAKDPLGKTEEVDKETINL